MEETKYHTDLYERIPAEKRERIMAASIEEFAEKGFRGANTNEIARKARVSIGSLFKYFNTKEDLFLATVQTGVHELQEVLDSLDTEDMGFFDTLDYLLQVIQEHSRKRSPLIRLYNELTAEGNVDMARRLSFSLETITAAAYRSLITRHQERGTIPSDFDAGVFAFCMDNLFLSLQFSYGSPYYMERMKIYLGDDVEKKDLWIRQEVMKFLKRAFR